MKQEIAVLDNGGGVGELLIDGLTDGSTEIRFLDQDRSAVDRASGGDVSTRIVDPSNAVALDDEDVAGLDAAIIVSRDDSRNFLIGQLLRVREAERVIALVNNRNNLQAFADAGIEPICVSTALATALENARREQKPVERSTRSPVREEDEPTNHGAERSTDERVRFDGGCRADDRKEVA